MHGFSNWLLGHVSKGVLINNSPLKAEKSGSFMSRTITKSPLPKLNCLSKGIRIIEDGEQSQEELCRLWRNSQMLIVLFQSQDLDYLAASPNIVEGIESRSRHRLMLLRNPFNWGASYMKKSNTSGDAQRWTKLWLPYAREFIGKTNYLKYDAKVNYNRWFTSSDYRRELERILDLPHSDAMLEVVTDHAGGSSFEGLSQNGKAQQMSVTNRWSSFLDRQDYLNSLRSHPEIVELGLKLFKSTLPNIDKLIDLL